MAYMGRQRRETASRTARGVGRAGSVQSHQVKKKSEACSLAAVLSMRDAAREIGITSKALALLVRHCEVNLAVRDGRQGIPRDEVKRLRSQSR